MYIEKEGVALREVQDVIVNGQLRKEKRGKRVKRDVVKVDQIYFDILAGVKEVQGEIKYARDGKGSDLVSDLLAKIKN